MYKVIARLLIASFVLTTPVLIGCEPTARRSAEGTIVIRYVDASPGAYRFQISNNGAQSVTFDGWRNEDGTTYPVFSASCDANESQPSTGGIFVGPKSLPAEDQKLIRIKESTKLNVFIPRVEFSGQVGTLCDVTLLIGGKDPVTSDKFSPEN
jgi:hypothetical protein